MEVWEFLELMYNNQQPRPQTSLSVTYYTVCFSILLIVDLGGSILFDPFGVATNFPETALIGDPSAFDHKFTNKNQDA